MIDVLGRTGERLWGLVQGGRAQLESRKGLRDTVRSAFWLLLDKGVRMVLALLVSSWTARHLGAEQFGLLDLALAAAILAGAPAKLGIEGIVRRELIVQPNEKRAILGTALMLRLVASLICYAGLLVALPVLSVPEAARPVYMISGLSIVAEALLVGELFFLATNQAGFAVWASLLSYVAYAAIRIGFIWGDASLEWFAASQVAQLALNGAIVLYVYRRREGDLFDWRFRWAHAWQLLRDSWPLLFSVVASTLYVRLTQVMLGSLAGYEETGIYGAATRISEIWYAIPYALATAVFPSIMNTKMYRPELFEGRMERFYQLNAIISYILCLPITFFSPLIVHLIYGPEYAASAAVLALHIWTCIFVFMGVARSSWLVSINRQEVSLYLMAAGAVLTVGLNLVLIPEYGAVGASMSLLVAQGAMAVVFPMAFPSMRRNLWLQVRSMLLLPAFRDGWRLVRRLG